MKKTRKAAGKASLDPLVRTESFKGMCGKSGRFAKTSLADMRRAGREGAKALERMGPNAGSVPRRNDVGTSPLLGISSEGGK